MKIISEYCKYGGVPDSENTGNNSDLEKIKRTLQYTLHS